MDSFSFIPSGAQARSLNRKMRLALPDSLEHIAEQASGKLPFDFSSLTPLIADMRRGARYPSSTFAIYKELVLAICSDELDLAVSLLHELTQEKPLAQRFRVLSIDDPAHVRNMDRYLRSMNNDPHIKFHMGPPSVDLAARFKQRVISACELLSSAVPAIAEEFDELVSDLIMVVGDAEAEYQFDGGSSYLLWGALFLNATSHETDVAMVEVMAHESAHILLYACAADEALVNNPDEELFASPLRVDPRPMDGIYHATFVSARMHWALAALIRSGQLDDVALAAAHKAQHENVSNFWVGHDVVARHGLLTGTGSQVMQTAFSYMTSVR